MRPPRCSAVLHYVTFDSCQREPLKSAIFHISCQQGALSTPHFSMSSCAAHEEIHEIFESVSRKCLQACIIALTVNIQNHMPFDDCFHSNSCLWTYRMSCGDHFNLNSCITPWEHTFFIEVDAVAANPCSVSAIYTVHSLHSHILRFQGWGCSDKRFNKEIRLQRLKGRPGGFYL